jgi:hypothetical protein
MSGHINVNTQEVGTGNWFTITEYHPLNDGQRGRAEEMAETLRALGLYATTEEVHG